MPHLDHTVQVSDDEVAAAMRHLFADTHNVAEGAGAAALAAALQERGQLQGQVVGLALTGGNVDASVLAQVLARQAELSFDSAGRLRDKRKWLQSPKSQPMGTLYLVRHGQASFGADDYDQLSPWAASRRCAWANTGAAAASSLTPCCWARCAAHANPGGHCRGPAGPAPPSPCRA